MNKTVLICLTMIFYLNTLLLAQEQQEGVLLLPAADTAQVEITNKISEWEFPLYHDPALPAFILISKNKNLALGIGGYVRFSMSQDFDGSVDNRDFVVYQIPVPRTGSQRSRFFIDASTSRMYIKLLANTRWGILQGVIDTDFRALSNRYRYSAAYVKLNGFLVGRYWSVMADLGAYPPGVDFQGPNAFTGASAYQVSYQGKIGSFFRFGTGIELPDYSIPDSLSSKTLPQVIPTVPLYVQGEGDWGHFRLAALLRPLTYQDLNNDNRRYVFTWGTVASSVLNINKKLTVYLQGMYGSGISNMLFDLSGFGLDLYPAANNNGKLLPYRMAGGYVGCQYRFNERFSMSGIYSQLRLYRGETRLPSLYRYGQYIIGTFYYNITPKLQLAAEYDHGKRQDQDLISGYANRLQMSMRYDF